MNQFSVALFEQDLNGDVLCVWTYPAFDQNKQAVVMKGIGDGLSTFYTKVGTEFVYSATAKIEEDPVVKEATIAIGSKVFDPEFFSDVLEALLNRYKENQGDPTKLLEAYLTLITTLKLDDIKFPENHDGAVERVSILGKLLVDLPTEWVICYNAMLLKKRVLVLGEEGQMQILLNAVRTLPQLAHRRDMSIIHPLLLIAQQAQELQTQGVWVAGTMDHSLQHQVDFDVCLSLSENRVTINADRVKELKMCSFHKDVAKSIAASSGSGGDDNYKSIRASLTQRTDMALNKLREISTRGGKGGKVTIEALQAAGLNESAQQWFLKLASSEGF